MNGSDLRLEEIPLMCALQYSLDAGKMARRENCSLNIRKVEVRNCLDECKTVAFTF